MRIVEPNFSSSRSISEVNELIKWRQRKEKFVFSTIFLFLPISFTPLVPGGFLILPAAAAAAAT